ncbi:unnamed protein product [Diatraea saccharalis]|uniref:Uncharacterized protein n=1 Tax=Diatraea saccharalis TaxID=40085 RepID=A0A9N9N4D1_9NEOP|nr:unnamed protein product [Diatraea saccharalis]
MLEQLAERYGLSLVTSVPTGSLPPRVHRGRKLTGMQPRRHRRRAGLQRWMTTPAEELSKDIWNKGLRPVECEFMRPLLAERQYRPDDMSSCLDSEQDDAEYVLTQMHKSKESLAKSQRKIIESEPSTVRKQLNVENSTRNGNNYN